MKARPNFKALKAARYLILEKLLRIQKVARNEKRCSVNVTTSFLQHFP